MIPDSALPDGGKLSRQVQPGLTYRLDLKNKRIGGMVDGQEALIQTINKILHTERYAWLIYNWDYGMELEQYVGKGMDYVMADLERSVAEALVQDDRILGIQNFQMQKTAVDALHVEFLVESVQGSYPVEMEVPV